MDVSQSRKVYLDSAGAVTLKAADYLASGGEGLLYRKGAHAYKLYHDPERARRNGLEGKLIQLSQLKHPALVVPTELLFDAAHALIGYRMPAIQGTPLVSLFANSWWTDNNYDTAQATELAHQMREAVAAVHRAGALLVDGNEMNYLVDANRPHLIDVDSWQIAGYAATAQMPSIRDYQTPGFSELTDWYAWGIVTFQLFCGIHPYKGTHPGYKRGDLEHRMRANASVFDQAVRVNSAVRDFAGIPAALRQWYEHTFQGGRRDPPPTQFDALIAPGAPVSQRARVLATGGVVQQDAWWTAPGALRHLAPNGLAVHGRTNAKELGVYDLVRQQALVLAAPLDPENLLRRQAVLVRTDGHYAWLQLASEGIVAYTVYGERDAQKPGDPSARLPSIATELRLMGNQAYALVNGTDRGLHALGLYTLGDQLLVSIQAQWPLRLQATQVFQGVLLSDNLGMPFVSVPFISKLPFVGAAATPQAEAVRAQALRGYWVLDAVAQSDQLVVALARSRTDGETYRLWLRRDRDEMVLDHADLMEDTLLRTAVTQRGVAVALDTDGTLTLGTGASADRRVVANSGLPADARLFALGEGLAYARKGTVYKVTLKP